MKIGRFSRGIFLAAVLMQAPSTAFACRCADQGLEQYYKLADSVFFGRVESLQPTDYPRPGVNIRIRRVGHTYKGNPETLTSLFTSSSSAACGISPKPGTNWLFFVQHDPDYSGVGHVHSCNGSRSFDPRADGGVRGFSDTPRDQVIPALTALRDGKTPPKARGIIVDGPVGGVPKQYSVIGLLELPKLLEPARFNDRERASFQPIPVFAAPVAGAEIITQLQGDKALPTAEFDYERPGAIVHETQPGWYRIALAGNRDANSGWIESAEAHAYWPVEKLLPKSLSYLTNYWDGLIWPSPGAGLPLRSPLKQRSDQDEYPIEVIDAKSVANSLWWRVKLYSGSLCEGSAPPRVLMSGWVPAFDIKGRNTAWFWSRGC